MEAKAFEDGTNVGRLPALETIAGQARLLALRSVATAFGGPIADPPRAEADGEAGRGPPRGPPPRPLSGPGAPPRGEPKQTWRRAGDTSWGLPPAPFRGRWRRPPGWRLPGGLGGGMAPGPLAKGHVLQQGEPHEQDVGRLPARGLEL